MTVRKLIKELILLKDELQDSEIAIRNAHGELVSPEIRFVLREKGNMNKTKENVEFVLFSTQ